MGVAISSPVNCATGSLGASVVVVVGGTVVVEATVTVVVTAGGDVVVVVGVLSRGSRLVPEPLHATRVSATTVIDVSSDE
ncbi:MAG TPA: hypothetical protein QF409_05085 [Acidimicrobiales bacterium]|jgi:hypothetical protein|nr:hypothetical protein [Acidimicrobiales bacterium]|tara:strand:- start:2009 stop:2248 length:240 start_codon:yes stop_codon:yes gene_type:complete